MTFEQMKSYTDRFKEITLSKSTAHIKSVRLASLMTDLEGAFQIPLFGKERIENFERKQPHIMQLYRSVSEAREF